REQKISTIALAHHADDQVELFFLRLLRGAGGEGLAGMKWRSPSPADGNFLLVRPLLGCTKAELLAFADTGKIPFREDATNFSTDFRRNRIRHELLPLLRKNYQQAVDEIILRLMNIVGAEAEAVSETARQWRENTGKRPAGIAKQPEFAVLPLAVQRKVLQQQLGAWSDFKLIEQLRETPGKFVDVHTNLSVARDAAGKVSFRNHPAGKFNPAELEQDLSGKIGIIDFGGGFFPWRVDFAKNIPRHPSGFTARNAKLHREVEFFDADKVGVKIILRHWRAGDRFQPIGMKSAVKLQDLFVNAKIPAARRRELVLAATATGEIFWVEGLRIGENFKLTAATRRRLTWNWKKIAG
ncbi:MAG: tRNA lysidine(34) synthetase TilS, partial [Verrucomicrobiota bacterium]